MQDRLPQRLLQPAVQTLNQGDDLHPFAFAVAAWMRYCSGRRDNGTAYRLRDPREAEIETAVASATSAEEISDRLHRLPGLFPAELVDSPAWRTLTRDLLDAFLVRGAPATAAAQLRQKT